VQLVQGGLDDARGDLDPAGEACRRREQQREVARRHAGAVGDVRRKLLRRLVAGLEAEDRGARALVDVEVVEQLLGADQRAARPAGHGEV